MAEETVQFKLIGIQLLSKSMAPLPTPNVAELKFFFDVKVENSIQANEKRVLVTVFVKIRHESVFIGNLDTVLAFEIIDFDKFIKLNEQGEYEIPQALNDIIRPVSISTVRGIIYSEFRGTYLHGAIMPVVFMNQFKEEARQKENKLIEKKEDS